VRASSLLRQLAKGGCAARRLSWVTPGFSQSRRCKTTASAKLACLQVDSRGSPFGKRIANFDQVQDIFITEELAAEEALLGEEEEAAATDHEETMTFTEEEVAAESEEEVMVFTEEETGEEVMTFTEEEIETGSSEEVMTFTPEEIDLGTELEFVIMVIAVSCVKLLSAHNSTQHTSRKHKV
jgi:hypothetical protein